MSKGSPLKEHKICLDTPNMDEDNMKKKFINWDRNHVGKLKLKNPREKALKNNNNFVVKGKRKEAKNPLEHM